jgi:hypothetical protein
MMAWKGLGPSPRGVLLLVASLLAACAGVLGIEDRRLDSAGDYPPDGYPGCQPSSGCDACLDVHQPECQARRACSLARQGDDCSSCVCQNCVDPVIECQLDASCAAIWTCLRQTRCDLAAGVSGNCADACSAEIRDNGGINGAAFRAAAEVRTCAVTSSCLNCLAPQTTEVAPSCNQQNGCEGCADCFHECLCSGEKFSICQSQCGTQAPPTVCTEGDSCAGCTTCFDTCACHGQDYATCTRACAEPVAVADCTRPSCSKCADCVTQCKCAGADPTACETECAPPSADDLCIEATHGPDSARCGGCGGCLSHCTCGGDALEDCMTSCGQHSCCDADACSSPVAACTCDGTGADDCARQAYNSCDVFADTCDACPCDRCPGKFRLCNETSGCPEIFACMRSTGCQGSACRERCADAATSAQVAADAFDVAESLWACDQGNACSCEGNEPPSPAECLDPQGSALDCTPYVGNDITIQACCPNEAVAQTATSDTASGGGSGSVATCGLALGAHFPIAAACEPLGQTRKPRIFLLESCPDLKVSDPPYNGAKLRGCCRDADQSCGVYDDVTGLGCLRAEIFGAAGASCL